MVPEGMRLDDTCTYRVEVYGTVSEDELNRLSPRHITVVQTDTTSTFFTVTTDQSGFIGLIRHLHGRGFVFLSMERERAAVKRS